MGMEILWLGHTDCHEINLVGGKAANLSRLTAGHRIPPGFCVTTEAYARWVEQDGSGKPPRPTQRMPPALYNDLAAAYQALAERCGISDPSVAVRSSGVDEDSAAASFAGQHETYLNIVGVGYGHSLAWSPRLSRHQSGRREGRQPQPIDGQPPYPTRILRHHRGVRSVGTRGGRRKAPTPYSMDAYRSLQRTNCCLSKPGGTLRS